MIISSDDPVSKGAQRFEVFTGAGKRRDWPPEVKASIVAECYSGREGVGAVARRHGLDPSQVSVAHARVEIAAWVEDYNRERPHSSLGYTTPAAFAAELDKQWPASLRPTGSATQPIASSALMRKTARL